MSEGDIFVGDMNRSGNAGRETSRITVDDGKHTVKVATAEFNRAVFLRGMDGELSGRVWWFDRCTETKGNTRRAVDSPVNNRRKAEY